MDWALVCRMGAVLVGLVLFGVGFNCLVARLDQAGRLDGYRAVLVTAGIAATGVGFALLEGHRPATVLLVCFAASGLPMLWGDIERANRRRDREDQALRDLARLILERVSREGWDERPTKAGGI